MRWLRAFLSIVPACLLFVAPLVPAQLASPMHVLATDSGIDATTPGGGFALDPYGDLVQVRLTESPCCWDVALLAQGPDPLGNDPQNAGGNYESALVLNWNRSNGQPHTLRIEADASIMAAWLDGAPIPVTRTVGDATTWQANLEFATWGIAPPHALDTVRATAWANSTVGLGSTDAMAGLDVPLNGGLLFPAWHDLVVHEGPASGANVLLRKVPVTAYQLNGEDSRLTIVAGEDSVSWPVESAALGNGAGRVDLMLHEGGAAIAYAAEDGVFLALESAGWNASVPVAPADGWPRQPDGPPDGAPSAALGSTNRIAIPTAGTSVTIAEWQGNAWVAVKTVPAARQPTLAEGPGGAWHLAYITPSPGGSEAALDYLAMEAEPFRVASGIAAPGKDWNAPSPYAFALRPDGRPTFVWSQDTVSFATITAGRIDTEDAPLPRADYLDLAFDGYGNAYVATSTFVPGSLGGGSWVSALYVRTVYGDWWQIPGHAPGQLPQLSVTPDGQVAVASLAANGDVWMTYQETPSIHPDFAALYRAEGPEIGAPAPVETEPAAPTSTPVLGPEPVPSEDSPAVTLVAALGTLLAIGLAVRGRRGRQA